MWTEKTKNGKFKHREKYCPGEKNGTTGTCGQD